MKSFVSVNLSQYPESLLESELFGHEKGAFTGAIDAHKGLFAMCSKNGSVFLDEIGDVNEQTQIKLLQVLQERTFYPVGTHEKQRFAGRVIAATNKSVDQLRSKSKFRDDFYYRLCSDCIEVPSLSRRISENPEELLELVRHTVEQITGQTSEELTYLVMDIVNKRLGKDYTWPGNVRELEQCIRRIIIKRDYQGQNVQHHDLQSNLHTGLANMEITATELIAGYCKILYEKFGSFEETARRTGLDRRTVKKYIEMQ
jgi:transcriptional regulator with GAF, ATPase, and Fis domain